MAAGIRRRLLDWYDAEKRDLPWRRSTAPYPVWVSEIMLQQTTVAAVVPYFERWMGRFPDVRSLASATEEEVLACWQGLGYYRRARALLLGARQIDSEGWPRSSREWMNVPGVGAYTAGAIASISLGEEVPAVDGNVERVFSRLTGQPERVGAGKWAAKLVVGERPGDLNQALMELGATVCRVADPACTKCPVCAGCVAYREGTQAELPSPKEKPTVVHLRNYVLAPYCEGKFGLSQIPKGEWWEGMYEFPRAKRKKDLVAMLAPREVVSLRAFQHTVTRHRIRISPYLAYLSNRKSGLLWVDSKKLAELPLPAPQRKIANAAIAVLIDR